MIPLFVRQAALAEIKAVFFESKFYAFFMRVTL